MLKRDSRDKDSNIGVVSYCVLGQEDSAADCRLVPCSEETDERSVSTSGGNRPTPSCHRKMPESLQIRSKSVASSLSVAAPAHCVPTKSRDSGVDTSPGCCQKKTSIGSQRRRSSLSLSAWRKRKIPVISEASHDGENGNKPEADNCGCERIRINVSGHFFETRVGVLNRHPDTLLGNPRKRQKYYDRIRDEVFLDRHRPSFEAIFTYYQYGGKLKRPHHVPDDIFLAELMFYELETEVVEEYKRAEGYTTEDIQLPSNAFLKKLWMLFEYPETSKPAFVIAIVSVIFTLVSIVLFCVETLPQFALTHCVVDEAPNFLDPFFIIETACTLWFTLEVIIRFIASPSKIRFWKDFKNIVDVTAIVPYYVTFINVVSTMSCASAKSSASLAFLRVIRLIRVFKLTKHSVGLQVLVLTFKASIEGLGLFLVALVVCLLVYSSAIYYAELGLDNSQIDSIPDAFWWAIITMTTVGYGDKVPIGLWGKLIGAACAITGVLTLAIPVPIITGHFNRFYSHKTGRGRHV